MVPHRRQSASELDGVALGAVKSCLTGLMEARAREGWKSW